jgi:hypothetical protein
MIEMKLSKIWRKDTKTWIRKEMFILINLKKDKKDHPFKKNNMVNQ